MSLQLNFYTEADSILVIFWYTEIVKKRIEVSYIPKDDVGFYSSEITQFIDTFLSYQV